VSRPASVYKLFNAGGELLYVGASMSPALRLGAHGDKPWWPEAARAEFEHFESREAAVARENDLLKSDEPRYNVAGPRQLTSESDLRARRQEARMRRLARTHYLAGGLTCSNCSFVGNWIPKGQSLTDPHRCPTCGCDTVTLNASPSEPGKPESGAAA
jgi:hypothetical protein